MLKMVNEENDVVNMSHLRTWKIFDIYLNQKNYAKPNVMAYVICVTAKQYMFQ